MKIQLLVVVLLAAHIPNVLSTRGVDVSSHITTAGFSCLKNNGMDFAIVRAWESGGQPDSNCPSTVANAHAAGIPYVDVYMFPCYQCGDGAGQVSKAVAYLKAHDVQYGMFWFDIEGPQYWSTNQAFNRDFMSAMLTQARTLGVHAGVYTSASQWGPIMGTWTGAASYSLWYAHYDNSQNFNDFSAFGGWTRPSIKQYYGDASVCGLDVDLNWYP